MEDLESARIFIEDINRVMSGFNSPEKIYLHGNQIFVHFFHVNIKKGYFAINRIELEIMVMITKLNSVFFHELANFVPVGDHLLITCYSFAGLFYYPWLHTIFYTKNGMVIFLHS